MVAVSVGRRARQGSTFGFFLLPAYGPTYIGILFVVALILACETKLVPILPFASLFLIWVDVNFAFLLFFHFRWDREMESNHRGSMPRSSRLPSQMQ